MLAVEAKPLVGKLNQFCTSCLESAAGLCINRGHYEVCLEHWLLKVLENPQSDIPLILHHFGIDLAEFKRQLNLTLESFQTGNSGKPSFSPLLFECVQDAWLIASVTFGESKIRSMGMLLGLLSKKRYISGDYIDLLKKVDLTEFHSQCGQILRDSFEKSVFSGGDSAEGEEGEVSGPVSDESFLKRFCEDVTEKARKGNIDPIFGRDEEIRQIVDILGRRRKNNPIAVGEPGVGKTALIEGLALRIAEKDVPEFLQDVSLLCLDMALLEAGASVKGEFENRLKGVIQEVKSSTRPVILFIDEAHTLIGDGKSDAANLLKPALARGELRTIAATTWAEYAKYFEKDPAMSRRFQPVKLDEPSLETTVLILRGLRDAYEQVHQVVIRDDAIQAAAEMAQRYINGRQQPDKSVDLLDTCGARVRVNLSSKPDVLEDKEKLKLALLREQSALTRDRDNGIEIDEERLAEIDHELESTDDSIHTLKEQWECEKAAVDELLAIREEIAEAKAASDSGDAPADLIQKRDAAVEKIESVRAEEPLVYYEVDPDAVAKVVSDWTGIPLGKVLRDEAQSLLMLEENFNSRVKGQDHGLALIAEHLKLAKSGLKPPEQPMGIFLLVGPSGVGKTETGLTVADTLFGGEESIVTINMSEFQEKHTISRLIGSPPGYVGYGEGGMLTEAVRMTPYTVVLLDEVEKSCIDVMNLFYQVFDKGVLTDGEGREVDFSNTVIFLTSNLATDEITHLTTENPDISADEIIEQIRPVLSKWFKPALLARTTVIPYKTLTQEALQLIVRLKLGKVVKRMKEQNGVDLVLDEAVYEAIAARCTEVETGARNIDHILNGQLLPSLSQTILENMTAEQLPDQITVGVNAQSEFTYESQVLG